MLQCVALCCSVLQCVAVCCSVLQRVAVCCSISRAKESSSLIVPQRNTLQHTATHCNTLQFHSLPAQHTATTTHYNNRVLMHIWFEQSQMMTKHICLIYVATHCNILQHDATRCNTLQHAATRCYTLLHATTHCQTLPNTATYCIIMQHNAIHGPYLQHIATHCNTLQHTATYYSTLQSPIKGSFFSVAFQRNTLQNTAREVSFL